MRSFGSAFPVQRAVICALAGLLIFYHSCTLYDLYLGSGTDLYDGESGSAYAWFAISALVATQYWAHFHDLPFRFLDGRHPLSYLKGFVIPSVITLLYVSANARKRAA